MGWQRVLAWALQIFLLYLCACAVATAIVYRPGKHKGPMVWPLVGCAPVMLWNIRRIQDWFVDMQEKYGSSFAHVFPGLGCAPFTLRNQLYSLFVPSQRFIDSCDPACIEYCLKTNFKNYPKGDFVRHIFHDAMGNGIFAADGDIWKQQRKVASYEFSTSNLRNFMTLVFQEKSKAVLKVVKVAASGKPIDLVNLFGCYTFDSIVKIAFGIEFSSIGLETTPKLVTAFNKAIFATFMRFFYAPLFPIMRLLNVGPEKTLRESLAHIQEFASTVIRARRKEYETDANSVDRRTDLLSRFMMVKDAEGNPVDDKYLRDIIVSAAIAGRDTITSALSWMFFLISRHPDVEKRIRQEIKEVVGDAEVVTWQHAHDMYYLHACISETLRLYPSVPLDSHVALEADTLPDGTQVRAGDSFCYVSYVMGRQEALWGPDAKVWKPERWLNEEGTFQPESQFKYIAFHCGPRLCLGKDMAYLSAKILSATLLRDFVFSTPQDFVPLYEINLVLGMGTGLPARVTPV